MKKLAILMLTLGVLAATALGASAQGDANGSGQFWVRLFEDRNGNGVKDTNEPLLTRGAVVTLSNASGVIIGSAVLDDSPNAAQGLIGFQFLQPGSYTISVSAAEYDPTTEATFTREIVSGAIPTVVEFGAERIDPAALISGGTASEGAAAPTGPRLILGLIEVDQPTEIGRIALALFGAVLVIATMFALGMLIYSVILRPRYRREMAAIRAYTTTGSMMPVRVPSTATSTSTFEFPETDDSYNSELFKPPKK